ncbi:YrbL family protein [Saccharospirillum impatiens]|uniref:YrbL family protein n=1 Tax=Saccharospirillum impatiens TaxID=169438 RepID=UPI00041E4C46|nr:YrbL family protein [Saccharospirillum impatiens]
MILDPVQLADQTPLLNSKTRWVYEHPDSPDLLIKVHMPRYPGLAQAGMSRWFAQRKDHFLYTTGIMRELKQFVESRYQGPEGYCYPEILPHIEPVYGVVETDIGLGLLVSAARDSDGNLAPSVLRLRKRGAMSAKRYTQLDRMLQALLDTPLMIGDLNQENIVLKNAGRADEHFVLIDGLGERTWIPTQTLLGWVNRRRKRAFVATMRKRLQGDRNG